MRKIAVLIASGLVVSAFAETVPYNGDIESVVVYTSGFAQVTRSGEVRLAAGETVLESKPLPPAADISSILVAVEGKQATVQAVEMRRILADDTDLEQRFADFMDEYRRCDDTLFSIQRELSALDERIQSRRETLAMLDKLRDKSSGTAQKEMEVQKIDADAWGKLIVMMQSRADSARSEIRWCVAERRSVERRLSAAVKKLNDIKRKAPKGCDLPESGGNRFLEISNAAADMQSMAVQQAAVAYRSAGIYSRMPAQTWQTRVFITVSATAATKTKLSIKYNVNGANWKPTYRVNADIAAKTAQLDVQGEVVQNSGEDWNGVRLSLSTARPDLGTDVPVLMPWYIRAGSIEPAGQPGRSEMDYMEEQPQPPEPAEVETSTAGMATVFTAQTKTSIPSDNETHRIPVMSLTSPIEVEHIAIPKILQHAFVQAKLSNRADFALIPGVIEVMVGGNYLGRGMMKATAPGEEIKLSLGIDEQVKIRLKMIDDKGERKARGGRMQSTNSFEITAVSYKEADIKLTVVDQLPISADRRITVTYGTEAKKALRGAEYPGQLTWELVLAPKKSRTVRFDFTIEYPEALQHQLQADEVEYNFNQFEADLESAPEATSQTPSNWKNSAKKGRVRQDVKF